MLYNNVEAGSAPNTVTIERLPEGKTLVRLADNVTPITKEENPEQTLFRYDEVVFYLPDEREETAASIEESFADWWAFGSTDEDEEITLEDRITALEEIFLMGMEV